MSTKTTLKRIALVAVSTLGFGLMSSVAPAGAAVTDSGNGSATNYTSNITLSTSSVNVVDTASTIDGTGGWVKFYVDTTRTYLTSAGASAFATTESSARPLMANETITVTVTGGSASNQSAANVDVSVFTTDTTYTDADLTFTEVGSTAASTKQVVGSTSANRNHSWSDVADFNNENNRYWFGLAPKAAAAYNNGSYTVRVRLENANGATVDKTLTVKWVSSLADSGARITLTQFGTIAKGAAYDYTENSYTKAVLDNGTSGGRVLLGTTETGSLSGTVPTLDANFLTGSTGSVVGEALVAPFDNGTAGDDYYAGTAEDTPSTGTPVSKTIAEQYAAKYDGVYGVTSTSVGVDASTTTKIRVRLVGSAVSSTVAVTVAPAATAVNTQTKVTATATGLKSSDTIARTVSSAGAITYNVPLSSASVSLSIDTAVSSSVEPVAGEAITSNVTWSGNYASANVTPADDTTVVNYVDAAGKFTVALENKSAVNGGTATVLLTGFASNTKVTITVNWQKPVPTTLSVIDPVSGVYIKTKSATVFSLLMQDQFGNAMSGEQIKPSLSSTSANYSASTVYAPVTTGANGVATWTLTDAAATDTTGDSLTFTSITDSTVKGTFSATYRATLPAVSTMYGYYADTYQATPSASNVTLAFPSTGLMASTTAGLDMQIDRDLSKSLTASATDAAGDDMVQLRVRSLSSAGVAATGAPVTLTAGEGGHVLDTAGLPSASRTINVDGSGDAYFRVLATKPGTITFTATSGASTATYSLIVADQVAAKGRTVTIAGGKTGSANGEGVPMTVTVTDRYGNGVKDVSLNVTASGVGAFMGGATSQSFTTDNSGTFTFLATSYAAAGGSATFTASASNASDASSIAGYSGSTPVDSTLAAGVKSASATVAFAAGTSAAQVAAEAASDAAAEAIDAANAATDAANLAAEAADAATVAAEEARDAADAATAAVEELATQVATLMAALKAQITTLANTVAKIAKKVRA